MEEIHKLRAQISKIVHANFPDIVEGFVPKIQPPNEMQVLVGSLPRHDLPCSFVTCIVENTAAIAYSRVN